MMKFKPLVLFVSAFVITCCFFCQKKDGDKIFAKVNGSEISQKSFESFTQMRNYYPAYSSELAYPGSRSEATLCVEVEAIYKKAGSVKSSVEKSIDWLWKKNFYPANMFLINILDKNLGSTDKDLETYYNAHKEDFKTTVKIAATPDKKDSTKATDSLKMIPARDSVFYMPFNDVRGKIARLLFVKKFPPDSAYFAMLSPKKSSVDSTKPDTTKGLTKVDTPYIHEQWIMQAQRNIPLFFMKQLYKNNYGKNYPDSLSDVFGKGKVISPEDLDMILQWIPVESRSDYTTQDKQRYLIEWLIKWKLFNDEAGKSGYAKNSQIQELVDWAFKFEVVKKYVNEKLMPSISKTMIIDTEMCLFEHWDRNGRPGELPDSASLAGTIKTTNDSKTQIALDKNIYDIRKKADITFLQPDFTDAKVEDPEKLSKKADSLYSAGNAKDAQQVYAKLVDNFPFTSQGINAMVEYAKVLTENEQYYEAVKNYRRFLILSTDQSRRCNVFFMIGFVYGEYLGKADLAQASYKWILKNSPTCELADDAEFMCLHLDEPMIGVDELPAEAKRQGKKVEAEVVEADSTTTSK